MKRRDFINDAAQSKADSCVIWPYAVRKSSGYPAYSEGRKNFDAHAFVCEIAHGPKAAPELQAAHSCGNKLCVNGGHLRWATALENMADAKAQGAIRGGGRWRPRFSDEDIREIRASNQSILRLAAIYGTDASYIGRIRRAA